MSEKWEGGRRGRERKRRRQCRSIEEKEEKRKSKLVDWTVDTRVRAQLAVGSGSVLPTESRPTPKESQTRLGECPFT